MINVAQMIPRDKIPFILPHALPWIQLSIDRIPTDYTLDELVEGLHQGNFQLWADAKAGEYQVFLITELSHGTTGVEVTILFGGGKNPLAWIDNIAIIEKWAAEQNFGKIKIQGRPGWLRLLRKYGYKLETQIISKPVDKRMH